MGFGAAITGGLILFVMLSVWIIQLNFLHEDASIIASTYDERTALDFSQIQTGISINQIQLAGDKQTVTISMSNTGNTVLYRFSKFDIIVSYHIDLNGTSGPVVTDIMSYTAAGNLSIREWKIDYIQPDAVNVGIIDPGEQAVLSCMLGKTAYNSAGGYILVVIATDNGIIASKYIYF